MSTKGEFGKLAMKVGRTKSLYEAGYDAYAIAETLGEPVDKVNEWIKTILKAEGVKAARG